MATHYQSLMRCERVNRAAVGPDHERGVPSDDPGALPRRRAPAHRAARARGARHCGTASEPWRGATPAALRPRPRHRNYHQIHLHRDHCHTDNR